MILRIPVMTSVENGWNCYSIVKVIREFIQGRERKAFYNQESNVAKTEYQVLFEIRTAYFELKENEHCLCGRKQLH